MAPPEFNNRGDLPIGIHKATLAEIINRFGQGDPERQEVAAVLQAVYRLAAATGKLERFVIFGSFVTAKPNPRDADVVLVMADDFSLTECAEEARVLFDHQRAEGDVGASIFWLCPSVLLRGTLDEFLLGWGTKRDLTQRGIVEVIP